MKLDLPVGALVCRCIISCYILKKSYKIVENNNKIVEQ